METPAVIRRKCATTKSILDDEYVEHVIDLPLFPEPGPKLAAYTRKRLKEGLQWADQCSRDTKRVFSPIAQHRMDNYKALLKDLLTAGYPHRERKLHNKEVLAVEKDLSRKTWLTHPVSDPDLVERLLQLRRCEFFTRYRDYMAEDCEALKRHTMAQSAQQAQELQQYWATMNKGIKAESKDWKQWHFRRVTSDHVQTTQPVFYACHEMELKFERTLQTIASYAEQSDFTHKQVSNYIHRKEWDQLKYMLGRDLAELPAITPRHLRDDIPLMRLPIDRVVDATFDRFGGPERHDNYNYWVPKLMPGVGADYEQSWIARAEYDMKPKDQQENSAELAPEFLHEWVLIDDHECAIVSLET